MTITNEAQSWEWCFEHTYPKRREPSAYCDIFIQSCSHEWWWYKHLVGTFIPLCQVRFKENNGRIYLDDVHVVRLTGTKIIRGRSISPKDVILL
jgi:hypothetical protein